MPDRRFDSLFVTAPDGLMLHLRDYGDRPGGRRPVLCLPGLSRHAADFEALAGALANDAGAPRRVVAMDLRGRGQSGYDPNPKNYAVKVELDDVIAVITALEIAPAIIVGTSRGGLIAMELAAKRPGAIAGVVLNDIGPVIERAGVDRIASYVGKMPTPVSYADGAAMLRQASGGQFPKLGDADWLVAAKRNWRLENGVLVTNYDPALAHTLGDVPPDEALPTLWPQFEALGSVGVMVIRGANSDILSAATVAEMGARHPGLEVLEIADQGHAPLLDDAPTIGRIAAFAARCDQRATST